MLPNLKDRSVVVIGAGNVGMDVAIEAYHCGAKKVTAVDVQEPAAFGKELDMANSLGTEIVWPKFTEKYVKKEKKIYFTDGTTMKADFVVIIHWRYAYDRVSSSNSKYGQERMDYI